MSNDFLWVEKYRPKTIGETILPSDLKATFPKDWIALFEKFSWRNPLI